MASGRCYAARIQRWKISNGAQVRGGIVDGACCTTVWWCMLYCCLVGPGVLLCDVACCTTVWWSRGVLLFDVACCTTVWWWRGVLLFDIACFVLLFDDTYCTTNQLHIVPFYIMLTILFMFGRIQCLVVGRHKHARAMLRHAICHVGGQCQCKIVFVARFLLEGSGSWGQTGREH